MTNRVNVFKDSQKIATFQTFGDFYLAVGEEAETVASVLNLPTYREKMGIICGFPIHTKLYFNKLTDLGFEVKSGKD